MQRADGRWAFRYDPRIAEPFKAAFVDQDIDLWPIYAGITCPTLVVRGAKSDLLTRDTWQQMGACGPQAQLAEIPGVGHAPMFQSDDQIAVVRNFLLSVTTVRLNECPNCQTPLLTRLSELQSVVSI